LPLLQLAPQLVSRLELTPIEAIMLWSGDANNQNRARLAAIPEWLRSLDGYTLGSEDFKELEEITRLREFEPDTRRQFLHGVVAGCRLWNLLCIQRRKPDASFSNVDGAIRKMFAKRSISQSTLNNTIWPHFKPVAHLWAAFVSLSAASHRKSSPFPCALRDAAHFLGVSATIANIATATRTKQSTRPVLDADDLWNIKPSTPAEPPWEIDVLPIRKRSNDD
jgi:hypothetical protein